MHVGEFLCILGISIPRDIPFLRSSSGMPSRHLLAALASAPLGPEESLGIPGTTLPSLRGIPRESLGIPRNSPRIPRNP